MTSRKPAVIVGSAHEQTALDEFELLRDHLPQRLRVVAENLAEEHVQLLRLVNGSAKLNRDEEVDER